MELRNFTPQLVFPRRVGKIGMGRPGQDFVLPQLVTLPELIAVVGVFAITAGVPALLGFGLSLKGLILALTISVIVGKLATQPLADHKPLHVWAWSQLRYFLFEPRLTVRLARIHEPRTARVRVTARIFSVWAQARKGAAARTRTHAPAPPAQRPQPAGGHPMAGLSDFRIERQPTSTVPMEQSVTAMVVAQPRWPVPYEASHEPIPIYMPPSDRPLRILGTCLMWWLLFVVLALVISICAAYVMHLRGVSGS